MCQLYRKVSGNWGSCGFGRGERNCRNQVGSDNAIMAIFRACTSEMYVVGASDNTLCIKESWSCPRSVTLFHYRRMSAALAFRKMLKCSHCLSRNSVLPPHLFSIHLFHCSDLTNGGSAFLQTIRTDHTT